MFKLILSAFVLALTLAFAPVSAQAALVSFNFQYHPENSGIGSDSIFLDVTGFLFDSQIPATGSATVVLDHLDVTLSKGALSVSSSFANNQTAVITDPGIFQGQVRVPFFVSFVNGELQGGIDGVQRFTDLGIALLGFQRIIPNGPLSFTVFGTVAVSPFPGEGGANTDFGKLTQPFSTTLTVVPEPAALALVSLGLLGLVVVRLARA